MRIARFVSVLRGNYDETVFKRLEKVFGKERTRQLREDAILEPPINVSSTEIRRRVKEKQPIDGMVPESVIEYIKENRLYIEK
jgi:nicotinic acid mononucleotide adenylyltransferase